MYCGLGLAKPALVGKPCQVTASLLISFILKRRKTTEFWSKASGKWDRVPELLLSPTCHSEITYKDLSIGTVHAVGIHFGFACVALLF